MRKLFVCIALGLTTLTGNATSPLWMRDVQISPDGTEIAFCYKGDIYKVSAGGGTAIQLTTQPSYECTPIWSPDSKQIAFASDRNGNFDIFVMPPNCLRLLHRMENTFSFQHPSRIRHKVLCSRQQP